MLVQLRRDSALLGPVQHVGKCSPFPKNNKGLQLEVIAISLELNQQDKVVININTSCAAISKRCIFKYNSTMNRHCIDILVYTLHNLEEANWYNPNSFV